MNEFTYEDTLLTFSKKKKSYEAPAPLAPIFDTHCHLTGFKSGDPARYLARACFAGVAAMVTIEDPFEDEPNRELFYNRYDAWINQARIYLDQAALSGVVPAHLSGVDCVDLLNNLQVITGVHPYGAHKFNDETLKTMRTICQDPHTVGIGEIGLDYHFDDEDEIFSASHEEQMECFARQIELAHELNMPIEMHLRHLPEDEQAQSHQDALRVLDEVGIPRAGCVLHCFGETPQIMEQFLERDCYIAFGGASTFKRNTHVRDAFNICPRERLLFETDCPYMAPEPLRGLECEPAMIAFTQQALVTQRCESTKEDPCELAEAIWDNSNKLFPHL